MDFYLLADSHLKHEMMKTHCLRPANFTELVHKNCMNILRDDTTLIHLGDVGIAKAEDWLWMITAWPGRKILIRGNHDRAKSCSWWMGHGFDFACDGMRFRNCWLTHEPDTSRAGGCDLNIHGHLHNIWDGFHATKRPSDVVDSEWTRLQKQLKFPWQRLFALEYTNYMPVEFDKFVAHPDKYQARGPQRSP
jgi:calcineurin-like phosphoesterase family protein